MPTSALRCLFLCMMLFSLVGGVPLFAQISGRPMTSAEVEEAQRSPLDLVNVSNRISAGSAGASLFPPIGGSAGGGGIGGGDRTGGGAAGGRGGIFINANGVMSRFATFDTGMLTRQQLNAVRTAYALTGDVTAESPMRCVNLNRLEKAIIEAGGVVTEEMMYLAGIQRIRYVFYYPESKDIVIAGTAEGWLPGYEGNMIGIKTGQPVCELQDFISALRVYAPGRKVTEVVGCSIDPTPEGNVRLQEFVNQFSAGRTPAQRQAFINGVQQSIGLQMIRVDGVPAMTHAARIMVAADYRMKRIGLGIDDKPVRQLTTFIEKTVPNTPDAAFRWFFVPDYESVILTEDRTGLQLVGDGVKLVGENEIVDSMGKRSTLQSKLDPGSAAFTRSFTQQYPRIAEQALVFAQLRN